MAEKNDQNIKYFKKLLRTHSVRGKINIKDKEYIIRKQHQYDISDELYNQLLEEIKSESELSLNKYKSTYFKILVIIDICIIIMCSIILYLRIFSNVIASIFAIGLIITSICLLLLVYSYIVSEKIILREN